ncbi:MAG: hypothetical protein M0Z51_16660 [Propionibacterium sp.]|nr:hypothetical protein [Propionibacterium sp.]
MTALPSLADARRLAQEATDGPWEWHGYGTAGATLARPNLPYHELNILKTTDDWPPSEPDAEFMAASRDLVPAMERAIRAVLAEHHRAVAYGVAVCDTCSQVKDADEWDDPNDSPIPSWLPWPCPTVRAITEHVSIEDQS